MKSFLLCRHNILHNGTKQKDTHPKNTQQKEIRHYGIQQKDNHPNDTK